MLADVPISVAEPQDETYRSKIAEAHQKGRLLLAEYRGGDFAALEQDVLGLFQLRQEQEGESRNPAVLGGNVTLYISKPDGVSYHVLRATSVEGPYLPVAYYQTGTQYSEAMPAGSANFYRLQYAP